MENFKATSLKARLDRQGYLDMSNESEEGMPFQLQCQLHRELGIVKQSFDRGDASEFGQATQNIGIMLLLQKFVFKTDFNLFSQYDFWEILSTSLSRNVDLFATHKKLSPELQGILTCLRGLSLTSEFCQIIEDTMLDSLVELTKLHLLNDIVKDQLLRLLINLAGDSERSKLRGNSDLLRFACNNIYQCAKPKMYIPALTCLIFLVEDSPITDVTQQKNILEAVHLALHSVNQFCDNSQSAVKVNCHELTCHVLLRLTKTKSICMRTFHDKELGLFIKENFWKFRGSLLYTIILFIMNYPEFYFDDINVTWDDLGRNLEAGATLDSETMNAYSMTFEAMARFLSLRPEHADGESIPTVIGLLCSYWGDADFPLRKHVSMLYLNILKYRSDGNINMEIIKDSMTVFGFVSELGYDEELSGLFRDVLIRCHQIVLRLEPESEGVNVLSQIAQRLSEAMSEEGVSEDEIAPLKAEFGAE